MNTALATTLCAPFCDLPNAHFKLFFKITPSADFNRVFGTNRVHTPQKAPPGPWAWSVLWVPVSAQRIGEKCIFPDFGSPPVLQSR